MRSNNKLFFSTFLIVFIIIADQATKAFVLNSEIPWVCNTGVAFGILQGFPNLIISIAILAIFFYLFVREISANRILDPFDSNQGLRQVENDGQVGLSSSRKRGSGSRIKYGMTVRVIGYSLIIGGSMSNILDRLFRGCIVDFIDLKIWPVFNLADAMISVGALILILSLFQRSPATK